MSTVLQNLKAQAAAVAETSVDMNEAQTGGGGGRLIPGGQYVGRVVEYTDYGTQPQEYQGAAKEPAPEVRLGVCLFYTDPEKAGDPAPYVLRAREFAVSRNEKATAFKAFSALNYKRDKNIKHFAQFLGEAFLFSVAVKKGKQAPFREYNVIEWDKTAPPKDPMTKQDYAVPEAADELYKLFLWYNPTKEGWDGLHIDGQRDDGTSKNFIQEKILGALDYQGSPLQLLLEANGAVIPGAAAPAAPQAAAAPTPGASIPTTPAAPPAAAPAAVAPPVAPPVAVAPPVVPETPVVNAPLAQAAPAATTAESPSTEPTQPGPTSATTATISPTDPVAPPAAPVVPALPVIPGQPA